MALVSKVAPVRKDIPHEEGEWFEFRPLNFESARSGDPTAMLVAAIAQWSYEEPVSVEHIRDLDIKTAEWAARVVAEMMGVDLGGMFAGNSSNTTSATAAIPANGSRYL